jgi:hypothetical protein
MNGYRDELYRNLPVEARPAELYDYDVILLRTGRFFTVSSALHLEEAVVPSCLPGALPLILLGSGFGTSLPSVELGPSEPPCLLLGMLGKGFTLKLRHDESDQEDRNRDAYPGLSRFSRGELVDPHDVRAGDALVLEDGYVHLVTDDARLVAMDLFSWQAMNGRTAEPLSSYVSRRDFSSLPLTRLR